GLHLARRSELQVRLGLGLLIHGLRYKCRAPAFARGFCFAVLPHRRSARDDPPSDYPFARNSRPRSRSPLRLFSVSRLSCSFLPRASASSSLARPFSLKNSVIG